MTDPASPALLVTRYSFRHPLALLLTLSTLLPAHAAVERVYLGHASPDVGRLTICWETATPGDSVVEFGPTAALGQSARVAGQRTLHRVEVPAPAGALHYRVRTGDQASDAIAVPARDADAFRVVIVGNVGYARSDWPAAVLRLRPHLLLSAGDNVPQLHRDGQPAAKDDVTAFRRLIDSAPELFRTTPFVPALGNHDREVRPRGPRPPAEAVYDVEATAFRRFFALPSREGWRWKLDGPERFGVRFVAVDLSHTSDVGTTWQTCHDFGEGSDQLTWYARTMAESRHPFLITIYNERHATVRGLAKGAWWPHVSRASAAITGFGYFAERSAPRLPGGAAGAPAGTLPCLNTSTQGKGDRYPDPASAFLASEDNLVLLTFTEGRPARVELYDLAGKPLDAIDLPPRSLPATRPISGP